ncbi:MAG: glycosyltransferase family 4 protein [Pirellulales bacterium]
MKVLALIQAPNHVCYRYRIEAFGWAMADRGYYLEWLPVARSLFKRGLQLRAVRQADVVILQRKLFPRWQLRLLRGAAKRLIYDFDDAVFCRDSYSGKDTASRMRQSRFTATVRAADAVIAGNTFLREQALACAGPERVHLIPTCVEPEAYSLARHWRTGSQVILAWIGQRNTSPCLVCAESHLAAAARALPGLELRVISDEFPKLAEIRVVPRAWSTATEAAELAGADIGISWLPDDTWSRGKCGLKVLQYMAAGLPVVANPVGMNPAMVLHGKTGFLASTPEEWTEAVTRLAADPALRARMGMAGRRLVETRYGVDQWAAEFASLVAGFEVQPSGAAIRAGEVLVAPASPRRIPMETRS